MEISFMFYLSIVVFVWVDCQGFLPYNRTEALHTTVQLYIISDIHIKVNLRRELY